MKDINHLLEQEDQTFISKLAEIGYEFNYRRANSPPQDCFTVFKPESIASLVNQKIEVSNTPSAAWEKQKQTLLKMILGMAVSKYDYDPSAVQNSATGKNKHSIQSDLDLIGVTLDADTIRNHLNSAKELFPDVKPRDNQR